ncbi:MAG: hypothetical protein V7711_11305 [Pseudomonadales bacterium]
MANVSNGNDDPMLELGSFTGYLCEAKQQETPWLEVLSHIRSNFHPSVVADFIDHYAPDAPSLRHVFESIEFETILERSGAGGTF